MSIPSADLLARGRAMAEARMTETVKVGPATEGTDPETLDPVRTITEVRYTGPGQIKYPSLDVSNADAAGQRAAISSPVLKLPVGAGADIRTGDLVQVTASTADASLVAREFRIGAWPQSGQVTAHRFPLEEVS